MLEKFSSLGNLMTQLQTCLKRSGQASAGIIFHFLKYFLTRTLTVFIGADDYGALLRTHVLVPQRLQLEVDPGLQVRCHIWLLYDV